MIVIREFLFLASDKKFIFEYLAGVKNFGLRNLMIVEKYNRIFNPLYLEL